MAGAYEEDEDVGLIGRLGRKLPDWIAKPLGIPAFVAAMPEMAVKGGKADWRANREEGRRRQEAGELVIPEDQRDPEYINSYPSTPNTAFEDNTATQVADRVFGALNAPTALAKGIGHMVGEAPGHIRGFMSGEYETDTPEGRQKAVAAAFDLGGAAAGVGALPAATTPGAVTVGLLSGGARQSAPVAFSEAVSKAGHNNMPARPMQEDIPRFAAYEKQQPVVERKIDPVTGMYSQLEYAFDKSQMKEGTAAQWRNAFKRYGVKDAEMYWRDMDGLFKQDHPGGKIPREAVQKWMDKNKVRMEAHKFDDNGLTRGELEERAYNNYVNQELRAERVWERADVDEFIDERVKITENEDGTFSADTEWGDEIGVFNSQDELDAAVEKYAETYVDENAPIHVMDRDGNTIGEFYDGQDERQAIREARDLLSSDDSIYDSLDEWGDIDPMERSQNTSEYIEDRPGGGTNYTENTAFVDPDTFYRKGSRPWPGGQDDIHPSYRKDGGLGWTLDEDYVDAVSGTEGRVSHEIQSPPGQAGAKQPPDVIERLRLESDRAKSAYDDLRNNRYQFSSRERARLMGENTAHIFSDDARGPLANNDLSSVPSGYWLDPNYDADAWTKVKADLYGMTEGSGLRPEFAHSPLTTYEKAFSSLDRELSDLGAAQRIIDRDKAQIDILRQRRSQAEAEGASESKIASIDQQIETAEKKLSGNLNGRLHIEDKIAASKKRMRAALPFLSSLDTPEGAAFSKKVADAELRYNETRNAFSQANKGVDPGPFMDDNRGLPYLMKRALIDAARDGQDWYAFSGPERMKGRWGRDGVASIYGETGQQLLQKLAREHDPNARIEKFYPTSLRDAKEMREVAFQEPTGYSTRNAPQGELFPEDAEIGAFNPVGSEYAASDRSARYIDPSGLPVRASSYPTFGSRVEAKERPTGVVLGKSRTGEPLYYLEYNGKTDTTRPFRTRDNAETAMAGLNREFDAIEADPRAFDERVKQKWLEDYSSSVNNGPEEAYPGVRLTPAMRDSIKKRGFSMFVNQSRSGLPAAFMNLVDLGPDAIQALETVPSKVSGHMSTKGGGAFADVLPYDVKEDYFNASPLKDSPFQEGRTQPGYGVYKTDEGGLESNPMGTRLFRHPSIKDLEGQAAFDSLMLAQNAAPSLYESAGVKGAFDMDVGDVRVGLGRRANFDEVSALAQNLPGGAYGLVDMSGRSGDLRFLGDADTLDTGAIMARMKELGMDPMRPNLEHRSSVYPDFKDAWAAEPGSGAVTRQAMAAFNDMTPERLALLDTPKQRMRVSEQNELDQRLMSKYGLRGREDLINLRDIYFRQGMDGLKAALARGGELPSNEWVAALIPALMQDAEFSDHGA